MRAKIVALTLKEGSEYAKRMGWPPQQYNLIAHVDQIRGCRAHPIHFVGQYKLRKDIAEFEQFALTQNMKITREDTRLDKTNGKA